MRIPVRRVDDACPHMVHARNAGMRVLCVTVQAWILLSHGCRCSVKDEEERNYVQEHACIHRHSYAFVVILDMCRHMATA